MMGQKILLINVLDENIIDFENSKYNNYVRATLKNIGDLDTIINTIFQENIDTIVYEQKNKLTDELKRKNLEVTIYNIKTFFQLKLKKYYVNDNRKLHREKEKLIASSSSLSFRIKRIFSIVICLGIIPFAIIPLLLGIIMIKSCSKGPFFFRQKRIGRHGKRFTIYKLRSMKVKHDNSYTTSDDDRIIPGGRTLRKYKIDELPQLYNVLRGDMSFIGPRPERTSFVKKYEKINKLYWCRHLIRPGLSGWAQINLPFATPEDSIEKLKYDLYYIKKYSLKLDLYIIIRTIEIVLKRKSN